jgi:UPF0716 protein FxsA
MPVSALAHGLFVLIAGVLLLTPGFATDTLGFALLIPPVREWISAKIWTFIEPNVVTSTQWSSTRSGGNPNRPGGAVIDVEAVEIEEAPVNGAKKPDNTPRHR